MRPDLAAALEALVELVADRVASKLQASRPRFYTRENPPPGRSWRACLEDGRRGAYALIRQGRSVVVAVEDYERWLERGRPEPKRAGVVREDLDELAAMGVVLPMRKAATR